MKENRIVETTVCPHCKEEGNIFDKVWIDAHFNNCLEKPKQIELDILKMLQAIYLQLRAPIVANGDLRNSMKDQAHKLFEETIRDN